MSLRTANRAKHVDSPVFLHFSQFTGLLDAAQRCQTRLGRSHFYFDRTVRLRKNREILEAQRHAGATAITVASDFYSLGVMLYELLTGEVPIKKETVMATQQAVQTETVPPLNQPGLSIPLDLEAICLKCLQKSPLERYPSAFELSADLRNWLAGSSQRRAIPAGV